MPTKRLLLAMLILGSTAAALADEVRPGVLRTPDERFEGLADFDFEPHYHDINGYRVCYLDEGPRNGEPILLLHGEPTWSYLYRKMIPVLTQAGYRSIVPDLIGFGRSDKPVDMETHTYKFHVDAITQLVEKLDLTDATFFGQDWGGLIGLRVVAENPDRFARVVISNTGLPIGQGKPPAAFQAWKALNQQMINQGDMPIGTLVATNTSLPEVQKAYDAPFPEPRYKAGPLIMPQRVPMTPDDPAVPANVKAWEVFRAWDKPFLTAFGDSDPITRSMEPVFRAQIPGAKDQPHTVIKGAGHFIQETHGPELAAVIAKFISDNPVKQ